MNGSDRDREKGLTVKIAVLRPLFGFLAIVLLYWIDAFSFFSPHLTCQCPLATSLTAANKTKSLLKAGMLPHDAHRFLESPGLQDWMVDVSILLQTWKSPSVLEMILNLEQGWNQAMFSMRRVKTLTNSWEAIPSCIERNAHTSDLVIGATGFSSPFLDPPQTQLFQAF